MALTVIFACLCFGPVSYAEDQLPVMIRQPQLVYPPDLWRAKIQGTVSVDFIVDEHGDVIEAHESDASKDAPWQFRYAAVVTVWQWKFTPGMRDGRPAMTRMRVPVVFERKS